MDMYESSFRLRGKTYDYKIQYEHIKKFMVLPKPDELHTLITVGLEPPLRQGQTRYPFLVMQFKREEEVIIDLNMTEYVRNGSQLQIELLIVQQGASGREIQGQVTSTLRVPSTFGSCPGFSWIGWQESCHSVQGLC